MAGSAAMGLLATLAGCATTQTGAVREPADGEELPLEWTSSGTWSHLSRPVRIVAYDQSTLDQVPVVRVPVDFTRQMVLISGMGPTFGRGMGVRIVRVWRQGPRIRVQERRLHPGIDGPTGLERASPWTVVVVPRSELPIEDYSSRVPAGVMRP